MNAKGEKQTTSVTDLDSRTECALWRLSLVLREIADSSDAKKPVRQVLTEDTLTAVMTKKTSCGNIQ